MTRCTLLPDIELLPSIANFFNISIDELMGFDTLKNRKKIDMIIKQAGSNRSRTWYDGTYINILRNAVQEFPNNYDLLYCLARTLYSMREPYALITKEEKQRNLREAISICTRILEDSTDDNLRFRSLQVLAKAYKEAGEPEKAVEAASRLPHARDTRDIMLPELLEGEAKSKQIVQNIWLLSDMFENMIEDLANSKYKDIPEMRVELFKKIVSIEEILHENNDYIYEHLRLRAVYYWLSEDYIKLTDYDNALECIERFAEHSIKWDALPEVSSYTSVIFQGEACPKNKDFIDYKDTTLGARKFLVSRDIFTPLREHARFKAVIAKLKEHK